MKHFYFFLFTFLISYSSYSQKVIEEYDQFEDFKRIHSSKKVLGVTQLKVEAIITESDTLYKVMTSVINSGAIIDEKQPYKVILTNEKKYDLEILNASVPSVFGSGQYISSMSFQIKKSDLNVFMNSAIKTGRIYYISDTYDNLNGGAVTTHLTTYLKAVYNRVNGIDTKSTKKKKKRKKA